MFSVSDIKEDVYPAVYRRGKELYETGGVLDFAYDIYLELICPSPKCGRKSVEENRAATGDGSCQMRNTARCRAATVPARHFIIMRGMCKHCVGSASCLRQPQTGEGHSGCEAHRT